MSGIRVLSPSPAAFREAARIIGRGGLVAFPTETYYGLAADPFSEEALGRLFAVKGRPPAKPVLTLVDSMAQLSRLTREIPPLFQPLMEKFWPGPLTLIFKARPGLSPLLTGGSSTIGIRISSHPLARHLASCAGGVITATSANFSGRPPAISAGEVAAQLGHGLDLIIDGGKTAGGKPSTILALEAGCPVLLREGMVAGEEIRRLLPGCFP